MSQSQPEQTEKQRQSSALEELRVLKDGLKEDFDNLCLLAAQVCETSVAAILVVESHSCWVKSAYGNPDPETLKESVYWKPVLAKRSLATMEDLQQSRANGAALFPYQFYAGIPLITGDGCAVGVLMVADASPGKLEEKQETSLKIICQQILNLIEYQKQNKKLKTVQKQLKQRYRELEKFSSVVSHDIKSPLANIISLTELLKEENKDNFNEETKQYIDFLVQSSYSLRNYVDGILTFYRSEKILEKEEEDVELSNFFKNIADLYQVNKDVEISYPAGGILHKVNKAALTQIFMNLISNALKYNSKEQRRVAISFTENEEFYFFEVKDNGNGIPEEDFQKIFELFTTLDQNDRDGNPGSGIGLATVRKLLDHMGGSICIESVPKEGSNFKFKIKRF